MFAKFLAICVLLAELHLLIYATLMTYLLNSWMADARFADATSAQWWWLATQRLLVSLCLLVVLAALIHYINGILCRRHMLLQAQHQNWISLLFLAVPLCAGVFGLIRFLLEKPFM